uniref:Uncharacterized protein n=1 Tax=viral metagenome TaxID=1070528 RepID=A0A6H2A459_9ZZZZ
MPDLTLCRNKRCQLECYRRFAKPDTHQSYSTWHFKKGKCEGFWACEFIPSIEYQNKMDKIIRKGKPVTDTLIEMLNEKSK